ncbi:putative mitochondria fission 1 protein [Colletotrichum sublineola]|uniref:Mitochondrial fission 1 protein n=1 Tax=Colletotrichum sublineola TaxID=1173701 RepID=A0A066X1E3_COLSU|nr:putative mitochondria fission 1 protein [Colletotrichum sublineola]
MVDLPYALDAETPLKASELQVLRAQYEKEGDMVGVQTKFNYAWVRNEVPLPSHKTPLLRDGNSAQHQANIQSPFTPGRKQGLVKSDSRNDQQLGVRLLSEIFRVSPERRRECLYYLALGNYKLGNYGEARRYNDLLLEKEPANLQASNLRQLVDDKVAKEGLMGVAIISGVAVAAGVVGAFLMRNVKKR